MAVSDSTARDVIRSVREYLVGDESEQTIRAWQQGAAPDGGNPSGVMVALSWALFRYLATSVTYTELFTTPLAGGLALQATGIRRTRNVPLSSAHWNGVHDSTFGMRQFRDALAAVLEPDQETRDRIAERAFDADAAVVEAAFLARLPIDRATMRGARLPLDRLAPLEQE